MDLLLLVVDEVVGVACPSLTLQSVIRGCTLCFQALTDKSIYKSKVCILKKNNVLTSLLPPVSALCTRVRCLFNLQLSVNVLPHNEQRYGRSPTNEEGEMKIW